MLKEHEKFISFVLLGLALMVIAVMVYLKPPSEGFSDASLAILNTIVGALTLAFGGSANALFKISSSEKKEIGEATATALSLGPPVKTTVENPDNKPVPVAAHPDVPAEFTEGLSNGG